LREDDEICAQIIWLGWVRGLAFYFDFGQQVDR